MADFGPFLAFFGLRNINEAISLEPSDLGTSFLAHWNPLRVEIMGMYHSKIGPKILLNSRAVTTSTVVLKNSCFIDGSMKNLKAK